MSIPLLVNMIKGTRWLCFVLRTIEPKLSVSWSRLSKQDGLESMFSCKGHGVIGLWIALGTYTVNTRNSLAAHGRP